MSARRFPLDARAVVLLLLVCLWFFWRLFTPLENDRVMLSQGDFSGQFVAFAAYQYERFVAGEVPLWNPYNNGGLPFIADTQAAVFYPPRLLTIALSSLTGGWHYHSLQFEMVAHVLILTLTMYVFVRRISYHQPGSITAALVAAVVAGYGGFISGYPPLQLALLEAVVWLPLALLGVFEATRNARLDWFWLLLSGLGLGLTWMAGHPQTGLYSTYLVVAYMGFRVYAAGMGWRAFIMGTAFMGVLTLGLVAVQFLPGVEYTTLSIRTQLSFDDKGNGFPIHDILQFLFPHVVSFWSPLFVGITGLVLAVTAGAGRSRDIVFWVGVVIVALALSLGANGALYHLAYNIVPGLQFFRGQERAAFLVAMSLSVLAGYGVLVLASGKLQQEERFSKRLWWAVAGLLVIGVFISAAVFLLWIGDPATYGDAIGPMVFSTLIAGCILFIVWRMTVSEQQQRWLMALLLLVVFELFNVNIDNDNYETYDANVLAPPTYIRDILADDDPQPYRIDASLYALDGNLATFYEVMDIRGTSPLFVDGPHAIIQRVLPSEVAWELFSVRYVLTGAPSIPLPADLIRTELYEGNTIYFYRLTDPRPYALLRYAYEVLDSDDFARALLADPAFDERDVVILHDDPMLPMPQSPPQTAAAIVREYEPERLIIEVNTSENAILSLSHVDYPGWEARLNGERVDLMRAYAGLSAVAVPAGEHVVELSFNPLSYRIGAVISLVTWASLIFGGAVWWLVSRRKSNASE